MLKASVGAEILDGEWHPIVTKDANSTDNVAVRATMCRRDNIDLRHERLSVKFARVSRAVPETGLFREWHPFAANPKTPIRMSVHASFFGAALTARPAVPRGYLVASMSDPTL